MGLLLITDVNNLLLQSYRCVIQTSDESINKYVINHFAQPSCCSSHAHSLIPVLHFCTYGKSMFICFNILWLHHEENCSCDQVPFCVFPGTCLCVSVFWFSRYAVISVHPVPSFCLLQSSSQPLHAACLSPLTFFCLPPFFSHIETLVTDKWKLQLNLIHVMFSSCLQLHLSAENNGGHSALNVCAMHDSWRCKRHTTAEKHSRQGKVSVQTRLYAHL